MLDPYRNDVEAARSRAEELEAQLAARDEELAVLRDKAAHVEGVLQRLQTIVDQRENRRPVLRAVAVGAIGIALGVAGTATARARPAPAPQPALSVPRVSVDGMYALATPQAGTGRLHIEVSDHELSCGTLNAPRARDASCPTSWRLHLSFPPEQRDVGVHRTGTDSVSASVQRQRSVAYGGPEPGATCTDDGSGDVNGTVEVVSATADEVVLRLDTDQFTGVVRAKVCGACKSTGMTCSSNGECCANYCGGGRCRP